MNRKTGFDFPFARARNIRMLILDVDGVLTDGSIIMDDDGRELKAFNVRDGHGIKMLQRAGIEVGIITGRSSHVVAARAKDLGIRHLLQGCTDKSESLLRLSKESGVDVRHCAFMGDDVLDIPPMRRCALSLSPEDAALPVRNMADWVSSFPGGRGAVRQAAEGLILAVDRWQEVIASRYGVSPADCGWMD